MPQGARRQVERCFETAYRFERHMPFREVRLARPQLVRADAWSLARAHIQVNVGVARSAPGKRDFNSADENWPARLQCATHSAHPAGRQLFGYQAHGTVERHH